MIGESANRGIEKIDHWVRRKSIQGGWMVWCRLCGAPSKQFFLARTTNYAEAERASCEAASEHAALSTHRAALDGYFAEDATKVNSDEKLLAEIFGKAPPSEREARVRNARSAAGIAAREERRAKENRKPKCPICGQPVSTKECKKDESLTLPSGALIHAKCVTGDSE